MLFATETFLHHNDMRVHDGGDDDEEEEEEDDNDVDGERVVCNGD